MIHVNYGSFPYMQAIFLHSQILPLLLEWSEWGKYCCRRLFFMLQFESGKIQRGNVLLQGILGFFIVQIFLDVESGVHLISKILICLVQLLYIIIISVFSLLLSTVSTSSALINIFNIRCISKRWGWIISLMSSIKVGATHCKVGNSLKVLCQTFYLRVSLL